MTWRVLPLLMAFAFLCHFNRVGMSVAGTERLMDDFHFSIDQMGLVYSAYLFVYTLLMIPGGWLIDRVGPRIALGLMGIASAGLVIFTGAPGWGLIPTAAALPAFIVIRGALGLATVPMHPGAARTISIWLPPARRAWGNGMVNGTALIGIASTYYLFGHLMDFLDWPGVFLVSGLATLAVTVIWMATTTDGPSGAAAEYCSPQIPDEASESVDGDVPSARVGGFTELLPLLRDRNLILVTASYAAVGYFQYLFFYWMEYYFKDVLSLSKETSRLYATIPNLAMAVGMIAGGSLSDRLEGAWGPRWGRAAVPIAGMLASALFAAAGVHLMMPVAVVACFAVAMGALGMAEGPFWKTAIEIGGRRGGMSGAIVNTGGNAGGTLAPYLTPLLGGAFGWQSGIELACFFCVVGAILWLWILPTHR
jgi:ACS family D-galactonate transporter-like MFS transporter